MVYNEDTSERIRESLVGEPGLSERKMFGGVSFLIHGNMCCGVVEDNLVVRVGPDAYEDALAQPHARTMDFTGRPLTGFVYVSPDGHDTPADLRAWIDRGLAFVRTLPPKSRAA